MKYGSKQHEFLQKLLELNPSITVGQAAYRLKLLDNYYESSIMAGVAR